MRYIEPKIEKVVIAPETVTASQSYSLCIEFSELERFLAMYAGELYSGEGEA